MSVNTNVASVLAMGAERLRAGASAAGVSSAVLVPRPETELLVERALALRAAPEGRVVDLGTGSGAIALALASERPHWQVTATDISAEALAVARSNAMSHGLAR